MGDKVSKVEDQNEEQTSEEKKVKTHKFRALQHPQFRNTFQPNKASLEFDARKSTPNKTSQMITSNNFLSNRLLSVQSPVYDRLTRAEEQVKNSFTSETSLIHDRSDGQFSCLWSTLRLNCSYMIIEFAIADLHSCLLVSRSWNLQIKKIIYSKCGHALANFTNTYFNFLVLKSSQIKFTKSSTVAGSFRIHLLLKCQARDALGGSNVILCHRYKLAQKPHKDYYSNYCFDCLKEDEVRGVWIQREEIRNSQGIYLTMTMPIMQIKPSDFFLLTINLWSGDGLLSLNHLEWQPIRLEKRTLLHRSADSLIDCDFDPLRSSEIEKVAKWRTDHKDPAMELIPASYLAPYFERTSVSSSGLTPIYVKVKFKAVAEGSRQ